MKTKKKINPDNTFKKPLVGIFPDFSGMGDSYPLIKIAERYVELGGEVVFFSRGGEYEYLAKDLGFDITRVEPLERAGALERYFIQRHEDEIMRVVKDTVEVFNSVEIKALVQTNSYFDCILAPRLINIPLISVISGTLIPPYYQANLATFPEDFENFLTYLLPKHIKNRIIKWYLLNFKGALPKKFNRIMKKNKIDFHFGCDLDLMLGDYTFVCDNMEFLGLEPTIDFPAENYIGPILSENIFKLSAKQDNRIENHLKRPGKSILLTMGSAYDKELFLRILKNLNNTEYNIIAIYTARLNENKLPNFDENVLLIKFVPSIVKINKMVDLAIIHGGRGTVYTSVYSGKPIIGIPNISEQQYNLDCLVRHGTAIRLSKKFFKEQDLLDAIDKVFSDYDTYSKNAQFLARKLPKPEGDVNATRRLIEILEYC